MKKNRNFKHLLLLLMIPFAINVMAQDLKKLTLENLIPGGETYLFTKNLYNTQWWNDECIRPDIDTLYVISPISGKKQILSLRTEVNRVLEKNKLGKIQHFYNTSFPWPDKSQMLITLPDKYIVYNFKTNQIVKSVPLDTIAQNKDYCTINGNLAYTIKNNLYVNGTAVTHEPEDVLCGQAVHRNEFGITKGTFWSPKGDLLAFYRMDERMVAQYPLVDVTTREAQVNYIRYPMAGMTSHKVTVGIYNPLTKDTLYLKVGDPTNRYFTNISWSPNEKSLYLIELNRDQNHSKLCRYDVKTGELKAVLIEEKNSKYVEPLNPIVFLPWDENKFIYQSQQDGFNHLYLYNTEGKLLKQITKGNWLVQSILGFNKKSKEIIIESTKDSPLQSNIFSIRLKDGNIAPIGNNEGVHTGILSTSGQFIIDKYSTPTLPRNIDLINIAKRKSINLLKAENSYENYRMPAIETGTIKAADGVTDLYYRLVKPADFDSTKRYPVIIYVYGGPHAQMIHNKYLYDIRGWDIYMANKGYIMFTLDNRGSENRGMKFENVTFRHLGVEECKDQMKGVDFLKSLPYIDANRIGVHGWSFGGHMTIALMLRHPDIFKVGVAGGPVTDWKYYEIMYGERYMDTPQTNPEGYKETDLKNLAENLKGHLLIIHNDHDDTCVPQHTLTFVKACIEANVFPDLFTYPGHKHNVIGHERVHLHEKITRYFEDFL